jgi:hypothetical protein
MKQRGGEEAKVSGDPHIEQKGCYEPMCADAGHGSTSTVTKLKTMAATSAVATSNSASKCRRGTFA